MSKSFYDYSQSEDPTCDDLDKRTYTALCQQLDGQGTIWVSEVEGNTIDTAIQAAREACAFDWGCDFERVHCLGLISGNAAVVHWEDLLTG